MPASDRIAIIVSRFNEEVTSGLLRGARDYLGEQGVSVNEDDVFPAPGAFATAASSAWAV